MAMVVRLGLCCVDDLINVIVKTMNSRKGLIGPINIKSSRIPNHRDCRNNPELVGGQSKIVFLPLPADDPRQRCPDISLAKRELDWELTVQLEDSLAETQLFQTENTR